VRLSDLLNLRGDRKLGKDEKKVETVARPSDEKPRRVAEITGGCLGGETSAVGGVIEG
jgi:hypothetical protein